MFRILFASLLIASVIGGCKAKSEDTSSKDLPDSSRVTPVQRTAVRPGRIRLPSRLRMPTLDQVREAESWDDRLATFTTAQKARLESLNARYYGVLRFDSHEEQQKLINDGFPMPEEWLAAEKMSDEELAHLADAKSPKGTIFFANRQLDRFLEARQRLLETDTDIEFNSEIINSRTQAMVYAGNALALTRSPFAAYMYGSVFFNLYGDPEYTAAAITVAGALGDGRASQYARDFSQDREWNHAPPLNFGSLSAIEKGMWMEVHRYRPL